MNYPTFEDQEMEYVLPCANSRCGNKTKSGRPFCQSCIDSTYLKNNSERIRFLNSEIDGTIKECKEHQDGIVAVKETLELIKNMKKRSVLNLRRQQNKSPMNSNTTELIRLIKIDIKQYDGSIRNLNILDKIHKEIIKECNEILDIIYNQLHFEKQNIRLSRDLVSKSKRVYKDLSGDLFPTLETHCTILRLDDSQEDVYFGHVTLIIKTSSVIENRLHYGIKIVKEDLPKTLKNKFWSAPDNSIYILPRNRIRMYGNFNFPTSVKISDIMKDHFEDCYNAFNRSQWPNQIWINNDRINGEDVYQLLKRLKKYELERKNSNSFEFFGRRLTQLQDAKNDFIKKSNANMDERKDTVRAMKRTYSDRLVHGNKEREESESNREEDAREEMLETYREEDAREEIQEMDIEEMRKMHIEIDDLIHDLGKVDGFNQKYVFNGDMVRIRELKRLNKDWLNKINKSIDNLDRYPNGKIKKQAITTLLTRKATLTEMIKQLKKTLKTEDARVARKEEDDRQEAIRQEARQEAIPEATQEAINEAIRLAMEEAYTEEAIKEAIRLAIKEAYTEETKKETKKAKAKAKNAKARARAKKKNTGKDADFEDEDEDFEDGVSAQEHRDYNSKRNPEVDLINSKIDEFQAAIAMLVDRQTSVNQMRDESEKTELYLPLIDENNKLTKDVDDILTLLKDSRYLREDEKEQARKTFFRRKQQLRIILRETYSKLESF